MDLATLIGLIAAVIVVSIAIVLGGSVGTFISVPSMLIVIGGAVGVTLMRFPLSGVASTLMLGLGQAFGGGSANPRDLIDEAVEIARVAKTQGPLALENLEIKNPFMKRGVLLFTDGHKLDFIRDSLTAERDLFIERLEEGEKIMRAIGDAAPAFGMIGTLVGLVQMLNQMDDPASIGPAMAVALLTTLYGAMIQNIFAFPMADKLASKSQTEYLAQSLVVEAVCQIQQKQSPDILSEYLEVYLPESMRKPPDEAAAA